ncbi:bifunctional 2-polyprenyl-6-hydroxyphenol methylase/3-demethylubiquinol 3-O-methyltransferase UbiG [Pedobacter foliorum]|uniref:class I SAM-dependent methyltransferase n=1 Tax=Pedobacter foliorum TaxID=2739058 RepID=UPI001566DDB1|nr:class I SAM-dependent methyltransferase [Pedobacter foliorum]NRF38887.1 class I SAM-dependent methyltransferase [Pedobacter foliorum]
MKENKYDNPAFFNQYSQMTRSVKGLEGAGEWHVLQKILPITKGKRVLDLGCGFGWHCQYVAGQGAESVLGIDLSEKMLDFAKQKNQFSFVEYKQMAIEDFDFPAESFDVVLSSLAFHYLESFDDVCRKVHKCLSVGGTFVFSVEHPVFTAYGSQDWFYNENSEPIHWPVDNYYKEGIRKANFLGQEVVKYHKTLTTYVNGLLKSGFEITALVEPEPDEISLKTIPGMQDELRRPIFLIISALKK